MTSFTLLLECPLEVLFMPGSYNLWIYISSYKSRDKNSSKLPDFIKMSNTSPKVTTARSLLLRFPDI